MELGYAKSVTSESETDIGDLRLEYDPEWLAITRVFHPYLIIEDREAKIPVDQAEETYTEMIDKERA